MTKTSPFRDIGIRVANAESAFIETLVALGGITEAEAVKVMAYYLKHKLAKLSIGVGAINVKHGAFLDRDVIRRAAELTK